MASSLLNLFLIALWLHIYVAAQSSTASSSSLSLSSSSLLSSSSGLPANSSSSSTYQPYSSSSSTFDTSQSFSSSSSAIINPNATTVYGAVAVLRGTNNEPDFTGHVLFAQPNGVGTLVQIDITMSLSKNGSYALHVHQYGDIRDPYGLLAGSHFNPTNQTHACWPSPTRHVGDILANFTYVSAPNPQTLTIFRDLIDLQATTNSIIGRAVIVHASTDNCLPLTGSAGSFYAQGVIGVYGGSATANTNLPSAPASAVSVLFPTATYLLRSQSTASLCLLYTTTGIANVSASNCYDRRALFFWGGAAAPNTLTIVVGNTTLYFVPSASATLQQYTTITGQVRNTSDMSCFSASLGVSGLSCNTTDPDQQFTLSPAMPSLRGTVQFAVSTTSPDLVRVIANITGLLPTDPSSSGTGYQLALHVHQYGNEYTAAENATGAGLHYDPALTNHHDLPPIVPRHMGDMGIWNVSSTGVLYGDVELNLLSLNASSGNIIGRGVVLHVLTDSGSSAQPTGGAQGRISLGVIGISNSLPPAVPTTAVTTSVPTTATLTTVPATTAAATTSAATTSAATTSAATTSAATTSADTTSVATTSASTTSAATTTAATTVTPTTVTVTTAAATTLSPSQPISLSLHFTTSLTNVSSSSFSTALISALSASLGIPASAIQIASITSTTTSASAIISSSSSFFLATFSALASSATGTGFTVVVILLPASDYNVVTVANTLTQQLANSTSSIRQSTIMTNFDTTTPVTLASVQQCSDGTFATVCPGSSSSSFSSTYIYIIIGVGGALVIAFVASMVVMCRRRKMSSKTREDFRGVEMQYDDGRDNAGGIVTTVGVADATNRGAPMFEEVTLGELEIQNKGGHQRRDISVG